jgi:hypothetical protein
MLHLALKRRGGKASPGQVAAVFLVVALLFLGFGAFVGHDAEGILGHLGTAQGTVSGIELRREKGGKKARATVRYDVEGSTIWLMNQRVGRDVKEGDLVTVSYDRREPAHASLKTPGELRAGYLVVIGIGTAFLVLSAVLFGVAMRKRNAPPGVSAPAA